MLCALCTFWGSGITPKTPSGGHASLGTTHQSQGVASFDFDIHLYFRYKFSRGQHLSLKFYRQPYAGGDPGFFIQLNVKEIHINL